LAERDFGTDEVFQRIAELKAERGALILAHYYQRLEIQLHADIVGDSFELSRKALECPEQLIVFCGVRFMAESAKLLSPGKKILLPNSAAGCPMADMADADTIRACRAKYPDAAVVCYVNSSAEAKAECDVCCTSSNAVKIVKSLPQRQIIFVPDRNLGAYVAARLPDKEFIFIEGFCPIHNAVTPEQVARARELHPGAKVAAHPECVPAVTQLSDFVGSTSQIIAFCERSDAAEFIVATEQGVVERLAHFNPRKRFSLLSSGLVCPNMKKTSPGDILRALQDDRYQTELPPELIERAAAPLRRMVQIAAM